MKKWFAILGIVGLASCAETIDYSVIPDYKEVSRVIVPAGKTIETDNYFINAPSGAVNQELPVGITLEFARSGEGTPVFILGPNDKFLTYEYLVDFTPKDFDFEKEVTVGFYGQQSTKRYVYELKPGADSTKSENWVEVTNQFRNISNEKIGTETNRFKKYLTTYDFGLDQFYLDNVATVVIPDESVKPTLSNGRYRAIVYDNNGKETYLILMYMVNNPTVNKAYSVFNTSQTGTLTNTDDTKMEIVAGFGCTLTNGSVSCKETYYGKGGAFKYLFDEYSSGFIQQKVFFRDVVVRHSSGKERRLNGYYELY